MGGKRLSGWFDRRGWSDVLIAAPYIWLLLFFLLPFLIVVGMSVATKTSTAPPFSFGGDYPLINMQGYVRAVSDTLYFRSFITSLVSAGIATIFCLLIGYPMALALTRVSKSWRNILLMLVILTYLFWRTHARYYPGRLVGVFAVGLGLARFIVEFVREPDAQLAEFTATTRGFWRITAVSFVQSHG
jgi:ABC-type glycerol-3-phosphate transport system permease component